MRCIKIVEGRMCEEQGGPTGLCPEHMPGFKSPRLRGRVKRVEVSKPEPTPQKVALANTAWLSDRR